MKKQVLFVISWLFLAIFRLSAGNDSLADDDKPLTDDDAGQLLYAEFYVNGTIKSDVLVFQQVIRDSNGSYQLKCTPYHGNGSICYVKPNGYTKLSYTESELTPEIVAMELAYCKCRAMKQRGKGYQKLAGRMNTPVTNQMLTFYADLERDNASIQRDIAEYRTAKAKKAEQQRAQKKSRQNSCPYSSQSSSQSDDSDTLAMVLEKGLKSSLKNMNAIQVIQNLADNKHNYFLAYCLFLKYQTTLWGTIRYSYINADLKKELKEEIDQIGEDIREKYKQNRDYNQNREKSFQKILKDRHGGWEDAPPTNEIQMKGCVENCYQAWRKTLFLSPHSEFPEWGNAMLEVLQMIKNPDWEKQFDSAFSEYQKYNNN